jgi:hypothetical protein
VPLPAFQTCTDCVPAGLVYIGVNQAVNPVREGDALSGNSIFAILCVYLFVVFYSFGKWMDDPGLGPC